MKKILVLAAAAAACTAMPASAARIVVEGGGSPIVYEGDNGNRFGLVGVDTRRDDADTDVNRPPTVVDFSLIQSLITSGAGSLVNAFYCADFGNTACTPLTSLTVLDEQRSFNSLLLEFNSTGNIVFAGSSTLNLGNITRIGAPPIAVTPAVPEPSTWAMLLLGFFGVGGALRARRQTKAALTYA